AQKNDYTNAISCEQKAITIAPDIPEPYINLGNVYLESGDGGNVDNAVLAFHKALRIVKDHPNALSGLGWALEKRGDMKGAIDCQRKALKSGPKFPTAHRRLAECLASTGDNTNAEAEYKITLELDPHDATAMVQYAQLLQKLNRPTEAATYYKKALEVNPQLKIAQDSLNSLNKKPQ
ncbi:MAG: tetratricopeptide repeat protein, partial [Terriglobales bacterium]